MRTIRIKLYKFNELSKAAKQAAIEEYKEDNADLQSFDYVFYEAYETVKKFAELFDIKISEFDFLEHYRSKYTFLLDENILDLSGQRLSTYIWNNYKNDLFKGKYFKSWTTDKYIKHRKVKSQLINKANGWSNEENYGKYYNTYYGLTLEHSCNLTGVCYDEDILSPIYNFLNKPTNNDFRDLLENCLSEICKYVENEIKYNFENTAIIEHITNNEYEFTKEGKLN